MEEIGPVRQSLEVQVRTLPKGVPKTLASQERLSYVESERVFGTPNTHDFETVDGARH